MRNSDRQRWDHKWSEIKGESFTPNPLLTENEDLLTGGVALDIACGLGQNSIWLAQRGYRVLGIDISGVAVNTAVKNAVNVCITGDILFAQMDIDRWLFRPGVFDLICVFRYLERNIFTGIRRGLREGALLFYATRHIGLLEWQPEANRSFLLYPGELLNEFAGLEILHYEEGDVETTLIARK